MDTSAKLNFSSSEEMSGWYLESGGRVQGPFTPFELVALKAKSPVQTTFRVSKKGFARWHSYDEIFSLTEKAFYLSQNFQPHLANIKSLAFATHPIQLSLSGHSEEIKTVTSAVSEVSPKPEQNSSWAKMLADATLAQAPSLPTGKISPLLNQTITHEEIQKNHLLLKTRLRLGRIQSPIRVSLIDPVLSLFLSPMFWFEKTYQDAHWHVQNNHDFRKQPYAWLVFLPGLNILAFYKLTKLIQTMENQHGLRKTKLSKSLLLASFPPFAMFYLQRQLNKHWIGHICMSLKNRQGGRLQ